MDIGFICQCNEYAFELFLVLRGVLPLLKPIRHEPLLISSARLANKPVCIVPQYMAFLLGWGVTALVE